MLKPKSQTFKLKFHLAKVQAVNNKVNSKVHAYLHIDNEQLEFKGAPQLKKNVAIFGSDLEYDNFMINFDEITGLYEQKKVLLVIQFQTQGAYIKIGQVNVNVGEILNQKKYRVVNVYPLSKCYDKSAKVKLAVDFIPVSEKRDSRQQGMGGRQQLMGGNKLTNQSNQVSFKQSTTVRKQELIGSNASNGMGQMGGGGFYKNPTGMIKSRLAQQQNVILQQRIYQYQKRMDNYRIAQNELSQRMQQQLQRKDENISELSLELTKQQNTIHLITLQNESFKTDIKQLKEQNQLQRLEIKSHLQTIEQLQRQLAAKEKQLQAKMVSLQNLARTKENKEKHLSLQIQKYTSRYSQSQQERNKIIFELENKLKIELEKKDQHYQELLKNNEAKYLESLKAIKERNKYLQNEHKHIEQLSQQQDSRLKALTLQLQKSISLTQQQQQQMIYLNQQLTKSKKQHQTLTHQLDSINFSYQQTVTQLQTQKDQTKQLLKKLQLLKTQLSLSNQTIDQQRERIIVMNKDLQVRQQREYYMKEHYEEDMYDREMMENNLRVAKEELQGQLKRVKEQLKLAQDKTQEEQNKNELLKSTLENIDKQLLAKNAQLIKLGEDKIYLQTQCKTSRQLISQLQQQLSQIQQQKTYLSQAFMQKKIALENDKSLQWTYKIQSLQNDIQLMVDKFKHEKESLKQTHRKQEAKKIQEINRLTNINKKLLEDIQDVKDKLSKRQHYLLTVQKSLKSQKQKSLDYQRQLFSLKQTYRLVINQKQTLQHGLKQTTRIKQSKQKQLQQTQKRSQKYKKDLSQIKNGFNRLISMVLQYMVKRYNERVNFQDISLDLLVDGQIVSYVNVALKKFCQDHNKTREMIKELQEFRRTSILVGGQGLKRNDGVKRVNQQGIEQEGNQLYQGEDYEHKYYSTNNNRKSTTFQYQQQHINTLNKRHFQRSTNYNNNNTHHSMSNSLQLQSPFNIDPVKQLQSYKSQVDRLKKQQAENKVKFKALQEEIEKQERVSENSRFELNRAKTQLQEAQDEITRVNFVLRKKDKIIKQLQTQLQQLQKQLHDIKLNPHHNTNINHYDKAKQKLSHTNNPQPISQNPSLPLIRDLQSKLNLKSQQLLHVQKQLQSLRQQYIQQLNEVKKLQAKLKEKSSKITSLQKQVDSLQMKRTDDKDKEIMRLKKMLDKETQQRQKIQQKVYQLQNIIKQYQQQTTHLTSRNKDLQTHLKLTQQQFRRNLQSNQYLLNDKSTLYQTQILQLKSQLSQQHQKCQQLGVKCSQLNLALAKKTQQLQQMKERLGLKEKELLKVEELGEEERNKMVLRVNGLVDRVRELETQVEAKSFQLEECKFAYEGRVLELERQMDQFRDGLVRVGPNSAR